MAIGAVRILKGVLVLAAAAAFTQPSAVAFADQPQAAVASQLTQDGRLERALADLQPQRPGVVDAYVVVAALDTDPVFGREAREAGRVLAGRFDALGRTVVLAEDEGSDSADAAGTPHHLATALGRVAALLDRSEDVLVLYTTSHGLPRAGVKYEEATGGAGLITPDQLAAMLAQFDRRLIILQACYSGQFIPPLASPQTVIATAASAMRPSFGCTPGNDWTFFGHALINQAMRKPESFTRQFRRAFVAIDRWERQLGMEHSSPQISVGSEAAGWLEALDARAAKVESAPVGRAPSEIPD